MDIIDDETHQCRLATALDTAEAEEKRWNRVLRQVGMFPAMFG